MNDEHETIVSGEGVDGARETRNRSPELARVGSQAVRAGYWAFGLRGAERLLGFARTIILARLLAPSDFGLFGIAVLALATVEQLSQTGIRAALIQRADHSPSELDTAWTIQVIRGFILGGLRRSRAGGFPPREGLSVGAPVRA